MSCRCRNCGSSVPREVEGTLVVQAPPDIDLLVSDLSGDMRPVAADRSSETPDRQAGTALQYQYQDDARIRGTHPGAAGSLPRYRPRRWPSCGRITPNSTCTTSSTCTLRRALCGGFVSCCRPPSATRFRSSPSIPPCASSNSRSCRQRRLTDRTPTQICGRSCSIGRLRGDLTLAVDFEQAFSSPAPRGCGRRAATGEETGERVEVPVLVVQGVSRQSGVVALEAAGDQQLAYEPEDLRDLDPADVGEPKAYVPRQRIVAAYQYPRLPYRLTIAATRHASESVLNCDL